MDLGTRACERAAMRRRVDTRIAWSSAMLLAGCAIAPRWQLLHPPDVVDPSAPGGVRLLVAAPLDTWRPVAHYSDRQACEEARTDGWNDAVNRAHTAVGDDAPRDLGVRRAVHARCVAEP